MSRRINRIEYITHITLANTIHGFTINVST